MDSFIPSTIVRGRNGVFHHQKQQQQQQQQQEQRQRQRQKHELSAAIEESAAQCSSDGSDNVSVSQLSVVTISVTAPVSAKELGINICNVATTNTPTAMATDTAAPNNKSSNSNSRNSKNNNMKLIKTNNYHLAEVAEQFDQPNSEDEADEREYQEYKRARKLKKQQKKDRKEEKARVKLEKKVMKRTLKEKGEEAQEKKVKSRGGSGRRQIQGDIPYEKRSRMATLFFRRKPNSKAKVASPVAGAVVRLRQESRLMKESEESDLTLNGGPSNDQGIYRTENTQIDQATLRSSSLTGSDVIEISKPHHHQGERGEEEEEEEEEERGIGGMGGRVGEEEERASTQSKTNFGTTSSYWCRVWSKFKRSPKTLPRSRT